MDALARSVAAAAQLPAGSITAVYEETAEGGMRRLGQKDAALLLAPLPFFLEHERDLGLKPRLMAAPRSGSPTERWSLVAAKDHPPRLNGYTVQSSAGYSPRFVHAVAPSLPQDVKIVASKAVLSSLRQAANGEPVAVVLDGAQTSAVSHLPFASALTPVESSPPVPVALLSTVGKRIDEKRARALQAAFQKLATDPAAAETLQGVRMSAFLPIDAAALSAARTAWQRAK